MNESPISSPNAYWLADMVARYWPQMSAPEKFIECPRSVSIALVVDSLRLHRLIDEEQEAKIVSVLKSSAEARAMGNPVDMRKEFEMLQQVRKSSNNDMIDSIIQGAAQLFEPIPAEPVYREEDDVPTIEVERRAFSLPQHVIAATNEEGSSNGLNRAKYMAKLQGLAMKKRVVKGDEGTLERLYMLKGHMPNFAEVIDDIIVQTRAQIRLNKGIKLQPILLLGKPGIGKTRFIKKLAACFDAESHIFNMGGNADSVKLRGVSKGWGSARPGDVAMKLANGSTFNPFFLMDEIEKAHRSSHDALHDVHGLLLSYLESETSSTIEDDYCGFPMDLSGINYVFAANSIEDIPSAFMSRVDVYKIPELDADQFLNLARMMVVEINAQQFDNALKGAPIAVIRELVKCGNARELRRAITMAIARAVGEGSEKLAMSHVKPKPAQDERPSIGFF